jgi:hypothetical protein
MASDDEIKTNLNEKETDDLDENSAKGNFCPKCGTENTTDAHFCENCGNDLRVIPPTSHEKDTNEVEPKKKSSSKLLIIVICLGIFVVFAIVLIIVAAIFIYPAYFSSESGLNSGQDIDTVRDTVEMALNWF